MLSNIIPMPNRSVHPVDKERLDEAVRSVLRSYPVMLVMRQMLEEQHRGVSAALIEKANPKLVRAVHHRYRMLQPPSLPAA
jgi:hypothetical protein